MSKRTLAKVAEQVSSQVFDEPTVEKAKAKLVELLEAKVVVRGTGRTENGSPIYEERPDNPVQLAAAVKILEWKVGKPAQTIDLNTNRAGGPQSAPMSLSEVLQRNPVLAEQIATAYLEAAKNAQATPIQAVKRETPPQPPDSESGTPQR